MENGETEADILKKGNKPDKQLLKAALIRKKLLKQIILLLLFLGIVSQSNKIFPCHTLKLLYGRGIHFQR